jgi:hypothetical protein
MQKVLQARGKAVKQEHKTAQALSNAQHKHDIALADGKKAANDLSVCIVVLPAAQATLTPNSLSHRVAGLLIHHTGSCVRGTSKKPIEPLRIGVMSLSKFGARRIPEM